MNGKVGKLIILAVLAIVLLVFNNLWVNAASPTIGTELAIQNVNGGNSDWQVMNVFQKNKGLFNGISFVIFALTALALFVPKTKKVESAGKTAFTLIFLIGLMSSVGCRKPYDVPEYVEVGTSQTAFVLPLEGDVKGGQAKFNSAQYLEERKVAAKRIQVPHRWNQTGRRSWMGEWIDTVKVILVDRSPVTREWQAGTGKDKGQDKAIWIESGDSVGFCMGWSCSAFVMEEDAATFLYFYPSGSLSQVMDDEIRARIQQVAAEKAAEYKLDILRDKKNEIASSVQSNIVAFFKTRGISITTVGMFGGMTYENEEIQKAIDGTFISQQEKVNAKAMLDAQDDKNKRIKSEAEALAEAARTKAKGEADGNYSRAEAEAKGIERVNEAIAKANNNPMLIQLKQIEVEKARVATWKGEYPQTLVGGEANVWVGMPNSPAAVSTATAPAAAK
jgi:hypothetical protein